MPYPSRQVHAARGREIQNRGARWRGPTIPDTPVEGEKGWSAKDDETEPARNTVPRDVSEHLTIEDAVRPAARHAHDARRIEKQAMTMCRPGEVPDSTWPGSAQESVSAEATSAIGVKDRLYIPPPRPRRARDPRCSAGRGSSRSTWAGTTGHPPERPQRRRAFQQTGAWGSLRRHRLDAARRDDRRRRAWQSPCQVRGESSRMSTDLERGRLDVARPELPRGDELSQHPEKAHHLHPRRRTKDSSTSTSLARRLTRRPRRARPGRLTTRAPRSEQQRSRGDVSRAARKAHERMKADKRARRCSKTIAIGMHSHPAHDDMKNTYRTAPDRGLAHEKGPMNHRVAAARGARRRRAGAARRTLRPRSTPPSSRR